MSDRLNRRRLLGLLGGSAVLAACRDDGSPLAEETPSATSTSPATPEAASTLSPTLSAAVSEPTQTSLATATSATPAPAPVVSPQSLSAPAARTAARVVRNVQYVEGGIEAQRLDLYFSSANLTPAPLAVYLHGGAFSSGDKLRIAARNGQPYFVLSELLSRGYVVASVNYRLSGEAAFPAAVEDCKAAIRFLRANAAGYGYFGDRIAAAGTSAGGTFASMLGLMGPADGLEGSGGNLGFSSRVQAVANFYGVSDFNLIPTAGVGALTRDYLAASGAQLAVVKDSASPITYVSSDDAPFLHLHGDQDRLVELQQSEALHQRLVSAGVESELIVVKNAGHTFVPVGGTVSPSMEELAVRVGDFFDRKLVRV